MIWNLNRVVELQRGWRRGLSVLAVLSLLTGGARGGSISETFFDPDDGMLDMTTWLGESYGFLPVPFIITEPAVGYGGGIALAPGPSAGAGKSPQSETTRQARLRQQDRRPLIRCRPALRSDARKAGQSSDI